tara:strand:- start:1661 stop:2032 length:372 start_codon:yes stop_codon:yes gene_type:complete
MKYDLVANIGTAIDNVYNYSSESGSRKTVTSFDNECLLITYRTILNIVREEDLHFQMKELKREANQMITERLKTIKEEFKKSSGRALKNKKIKDYDSCETLTNSPFSPMKKIKFSCTYVYEVE